MYDAQDRLIQDADYVYAYDAEGQLVSQEARGSGHTTTSAWNSFGQLVRMEHPDGAETTFPHRQRLDATRFLFAEVLVID